MTAIEAIDLLDNLIGMLEDSHGSDYDTALKMAIKSLGIARSDAEMDKAIADDNTEFFKCRRCKYFHSAVCRYSSENGIGYGCIDFEEVEE